MKTPLYGIGFLLILWVAAWYAARGLRRREERRKLEVYAYVSRHVPPENREYPLPFGFFAKVAPFAPKLQRRLLETAISKEWSLGELDDFIEKLKSPPEDFS